MLRIIGSLSSEVFSEGTRQPEVSLFSLLICLDATKFVLLAVFTLIETICPNICSKSRLNQDRKKSTSGLRASLKNVAF